MPKISQSVVNEFFERQLKEWGACADAFAAIGTAETKMVDVDGFQVKVQFNKARIRSSAAKVDKKSIAKRPCFLCDSNRPAEQSHLLWGEYKILVNPFPICRFHLTVPASHAPQHMSQKRFEDMLKLSKQLPESLVFYNGPQCGASAPDHFHFQVVGKDELPIVETIEKGAELPFGIITLRDSGRFDEIMSLLPKSDDEIEPKVNILCYTDESGEPQAVIIPRRAHRPDFYGPEEGQMLVSPASIDLAGIMVAPRSSDYEAFTPERLHDIYSQLCYSQSEVNQMLTRNGTISVGIMEEHEITVEFISGFAELGEKSFKADSVSEPINFTATEGEGVFTLRDVTIGKQFHWQRRENQTFKGNLELRPYKGKILAINHVDIETYLKSVISSEMSANASLELLKAHSVISRSWVISQREHRHNSGCRIDREGFIDSDKMIVKWYDHDDHDLFDVCADDHCQRYQGITRQTNPRVNQAVEATRGEVLIYDNKLCDARFSKCCGGVMETFESCWEDDPKPYLKPLADKPDETDVPNLADEATAYNWINSRPDSFCNTADPVILSQVLNNYDQETADFYRWTVEYTPQQLSSLVKRKSGIDFGEISELTPIKRGPSGRIILLKIKGSKRELTVGKELEIRRWLSETHLYSSAFTVSRADNGNFILNGAGWGHGAGLCQIGAAVMGAKGYNYRQILAHYYPGAELRKISINQE